MDIPKLGLGFWCIKKEDAEHVVLDGLEAGFLHIDTAVAYENEQEIGDTLQKYKIDRKYLWITSKIPAEVKSFDGAKREIEESLRRLQCDYLDLMLIHAPKPWSEMGDNAKFPYRYEKENLEVWRALEEAQKEGKIKNIGVSNFSVSDIENIMKNSTSKIYANQIRLHVGYVEWDVVEFCKKNDIVVEAYSPNAVGRLIDNPEIKSIADKYGVSNAQLCIQYCLQIAPVALPRSKSKEHIREDFNFNFTISEEDMKKLNEIKE